MSKSANPSKANGSRQPGKNRITVALDVIKGIMVGTGTLYLTTGSIVVTAIGAVIAVLGGLYLVAR
ncbi:hypothetical protein AB0J55_15130 [Amycolatopsis sp. NPDC049688]|uniref:hypothetical protein n=1 Tax=Amycolatopsis sp. NPDC049688 TaxID=3154733 RepID=UPI0034389522